MFPPHFVCCAVANEAHFLSVPNLIPSRRTTALHQHRCSEPEATYFVTCCTQGRKSGLTVLHIAETLKQVFAGLDAQGDTVTRAFTMMPDHVHWLFTLGRRLTLGRVISRWKMQTKNTLLSTGLAWQRDFFEHKLRPDELSEPYALYIFLNPYRAGLLQTEKGWPYWHCPDPKRFEFMTSLTPAGGPPPEWIDMLIPIRLATGE